MINFTARLPVNCINIADLFIEDLDFLDVEIDLAEYIEIKRLQGLVEMVDKDLPVFLHTVALDCYTAVNEEGEESSYRECGTEMVTTKNKVYFYGDEKHTEISWESDSIKIDDLDDHFNELT